MRARFRDGGISPMVLAAVVVIAGAWAGVVTADTMEAESVRLIGCLSPGNAEQAEAGEYTLIEHESGDWIPVTGSEELADHLGKTVKVTGSWEYDPSNRRLFAAKTVTVVSDSCEEQG